jgi:uncharacterized protein YjiS (DUF1127 family)
MPASNVRGHPAFAGYDIPETNGALNGLRRFLANWSAWTEERRAYRQAVTELSALSDRNLADIGVSRVDIPAIARETAKAKRAEAGL